MRRTALILLWVACAAMAMAQIKTQTTEQERAG